MVVLLVLLIVFVDSSLAGRPRCFSNSDNFREVFVGKKKKCRYRKVRPAAGGAIGAAHPPYPTIAREIADAIFSRGMPCCPWPLRACPDSVLPCGKAGRVLNTMHRRAASTRPGLSRRIEEVYARPGRFQNQHATRTDTLAAHPLIKTVMPQAIVSNRGKSEEDSRQAAPRAVEACGTSAFLSERTWAGDDSRCSWAGGPNESERLTALL